MLHIAAGRVGDRFSALLAVPSLSLPRDRQLLVRSGSSSLRLPWSALRWPVAIRWSSRPGQFPTNISKDYPQSHLSSSELLSIVLICVLFLS